MASRAPRRLHGWSFVAALSVVIGVGLVVASGVGALLWLGLGRPAVAAHPPLAPADLLEIVRLALFVTGGLGGVMALVVAYRRQRVVEDANERAEEIESREHVKLRDERFAAAAALLGNSDSVVRLAGAYAFAGLADDWPEQRQACINMLCGLSPNALSTRA